MPSGGKIDATHAPGRGRELDSIRVEYSEPLAAGTSRRQGTHRLCAVHGVDGCARTRFCLFLKNISYTLEKARLRQQKNSEQHRQAAQRPPQTGVHTAQHTSQQPGIPQPAFISSPSVGCGLLTALWLARHK